MHQHFRAISLSFKKAPVEVREKVALNEQSARGLLNKIREFSDLSDVLVLSTCNRTEIYYLSKDDRSDELLKLLGVESNIQNIGQYRSHFKFYTETDQAVRHLFRVSTGLDAQVVGDMQISNQVKSAYQLSADEQTAGPFLHRLMHTVFYTNKRVVQETAFRDGAASASYAAAEMVDDFASKLSHPKVLVLGLGEIGEDACRNLVNSGIQDITIANRTAQKAQAVANECGFKTIPFSEVEDAILVSDIIISSIAQDQPFITPQILGRREILSYKYLLDLAVPRSVDPTCEEIPGMLIYNIDMIRSKATDALNRRLASIPEVERIITEVMTEFEDWSKEMEVSPTINKLKDALERIRKDELKKHLKGLGKAEEARLEKITKNIMQKVMTLPVVQLKAACKRGEAETLIDVLNDLFDLEKKPEKSLK